jgi:hypothetical protein
MAVLFRQRKTRGSVAGPGGGREEREQCVSFESGPFQCDVRLLILGLAVRCIDAIILPQDTYMYTFFGFIIYAKGRKCNINAGKITLGSDTLRKRTRDALLISRNAPE